MVFVTHHVEEAVILGQKVVVLDSGQMVGEFSVEDLIVS